MGNWRKALARIAEDPRPNGYRYHDLVPILEQLGFILATQSGTSHRFWKRKMPNGSTVRILIPTSGSGPVRAVYVKKMVRALREHGLYPLQERDDDVVD